MTTLIIRAESRKNIIYEKIELIVPEKRQALIEDLKKRGKALPTIAESNKPKIIYRK